MGNVGSKPRLHYSAFYDQLTSPRMETLSRMHHHFGREVFGSGPDVVPDEVVRLDHPDGFVFTP